MSKKKGGMTALESGDSVKIMQGPQNMTSEGPIQITAGNILVADLFGATTTTHLLNPSTGYFVRLHLSRVYYHNIIFL